jgi:predicted Zn-dependent protease
MLREPSPHVELRLKMPYQRRRLEVSAEKRERLFIRLSLGILVALIAFIALCWAGRRGYVQWQERRLVLRGNIAYDKGDYRTASLAARTALNLKKDSVGAARILAEIGEQNGDRSAVEWRRTIAEIDPHSPNAAIEWAKSALVFHDLATANSALQRVAEQDRGTAPYHATVALLAQARRDDAAAEAELSKAVELAPDDPSYQLLLAVQRLHSADPARHAEGEKTLKRLMAVPQQRAPATRALIADGLQKRINGPDLVALAEQLQSYPDATLIDKMMYLDFMRQAGDPNFSSYLTKLEKAAANDPIALTQLLSWMSVHSLNLLALDFLRSLPPDTEKQWPAPMAVANIYLHLKEWPKLLACTKDPWKQEFLRHAFISYALRGQEKDSAAQGEWAAAVREASDDSGKLISLLSLTADWRWEPESVDLLWELAKRPERQHEAITTLYQHYAKSNDTAGLHRVLLRLIALDPNNLNVQNNLAQISMLLGAQVEEARRSAADIYKKDSSNPAYVTTYAYAQLSQGNVKEAARAMNSLSEAQRADPSISAYYGLCLAAAKDPKAREFLEVGKQANLLPEEKALVEAALSRLK